MEIAQQEEAAPPASSLASAAARIDGWLGRLVEWPVAVLTALEVIILFVGVVSRYVFRNPFVWSDELASILFLWLAMLGAVVAFRRSEHMRMSTLVARASPKWRAFFDAFAVAVAVAFLALILHPAIEYAHDEAAIVTPAMEIPNIWRASALPALRHRVLLNFEGEADGIKTDQVIDAIMKALPETKTGGSSKERSAHVGAA